MTVPADISLPDLSTCDREPIHIPGAIQPQGVLLVLDPDSRQVVQASANAPALLGLPLDQVLGAPLDTLLQLAIDADFHEPRPYHSRWLSAVFPARGEALPQRWSGIAHFYPRQLLIELAPDAEHFDEEPLRLVYELAHKLENDHSVARAADRVARMVREQLGYDRVMVYRFDPQWNGEVIAEAVRHGLEPYLGLNYPATDIPSQARALYLRNRVRSIGDIGYVPVPLIPAHDPRDDRPTDLSDISLRAVSPVHIEYLSNMGVTGTLVASVIINGRLWGLISCHHYQPLYVDSVMRTFTDGVARALATRAGAIEELAKVDVESNLLTVREKLITAFNENEHVTPQLLGELAPELLETVDADGVAIFAGDQVSRYGQAPDVETLRRIRDYIVREADPLQQGITGVLHTDSLGATFPGLAEGTIEAAGIIFMPLQYDTHNAILWTRRERVHDVRWGGNPYLSKLENIPGARLSPRQSFDTWQETVRGHSRPWQPQHLESARSLRVMLELLERKHYQQNFALMRATLARLHDAIVITSAQSGEWAQAPINFVNEAFVAATGHASETVIGQPFASLLELNASDAAALQQLQPNLQAHRACHIELGVRMANGQVRRVRLELDPVSDRQGQLTHWLIMQRLR